MTKPVVRREMLVPWIARTLRVDVARVEMALAAELQEKYHWSCVRMMEERLCAQLSLPWPLIELKPLKGDRLFVEPRQEGVKVFSSQSHFQRLQFRRFKETSEQREVQLKSIIVRTAKEWGLYGPRHSCAGFPSYGDQEFFAHYYSDRELTRGERQLFCAERVAIPANQILVSDVVLLSRRMGRKGAEMHAQLLALAEYWRMTAGSTASGATGSRVQPVQAAP